MDRRTSGSSSISTTTSTSPFSAKFPSPAPPTSAPAPGLPPLPLELWFHIAELVPPPDLPKLIGVHRVFFEMIMSELYSQLSFISADPRVVCEKLRSLQNPGLAERVRVLTIWPSAVRDAIRATEPERLEPERSQTPKPKPKPGHVRYLSKGREYVEDLLGHHRSASPPISSSRPSTPKEPLPSPIERVELFKAALRLLTRVDSLELHWYLDKGGEHAWTFPLFPQIWRGVAPGLRKLTLDIQLFKMGDVVLSCIALPRLEELQLTLRCDAARGHPGDTVVPYFVNKFAATLRVLGIKTIGHQELSQNFQLLGTFPRLRALAVIMPLDAYHLRDPSGFRQFLVNHPRLGELCVRYTRCCRDCVDDEFTTVYGKHRLYSDISMPALHSLELGLHIPFPLGIASSLYSSVAQLGSGLTSLTLKDRNLKLDEIKTVLRLFPSNRLKKLSLFARLLSPQVIDFIAQACPTLNSLSLDVETVVKSEPSQFDLYHNDVDGFAQALFNYAVDLDNDRWRYRTWTLSDVAVMRWEFQVGHQYNWACMSALARVVPSVRSFAGRGHMEQEQDVVLKPGTQRLLVDLGGRTKPFDT
ncbi:hypothetical protein GALMADRAFT_212831 [Galerina marginata CBS 339.88]|uniref:F-box domain-containing protein n=1 Tax=Galerina marginata (strain CBS 339.88) TaxID=685588 RepID=A0A067SPH5_GALM3|nr:hypothetical protein GALMADRAFT_212831 [Galerina marginata CBS 339.88]